MDCGSFTGDRDARNVLDRPNCMADVASEWQTEEEMTWRKWWALETMAGAGVVSMIWPLDRLHFWSAIGLITVMMPCYLKRVLAYNVEKNR